MNRRQPTVLRVLARGLLDEPAACALRPIPARERAAIMLCGIAYQCDPSEFADGRIPERVLHAWAPERPDVFPGEPVTEREAAFEWLDLVTKALGLDDRRA